tara:strand:+ start:5383 stop:6150 length:768 start_codon:yes stop_codon:yes gene_type:complete
MAGPDFLTGTNESKVFDFGASPYSPLNNKIQTHINIPASTKTIVTANFLRASPTGKAFSSILLSDGSNNLSSVATFNTRRTTGTDPLLMQVNVYDVSNRGALTCSQNSILDSTSSADALLLVLLSEGYFQSATATSGFGDEYDFSVYNSNAANCSVASIVLSDLQSSSAPSLSGVTSPLFEIIGTHSTSTDATGKISASCVGSLSDDKTQEYAYKSDLGASKRFQEIQLIFSNQPNPFADIDPRGDIISHDIITN